MNMENNELFPFEEEWKDEDEKKLSMEKCFVIGKKRQTGNSFWLYDEELNKRISDQSKNNLREYQKIILDLFEDDNLILNSDSIFPKNVIKGIK